MVFFFLIFLVVLNLISFFKAWQRKSKGILTKSWICKGAHWCWCYKTWLQNSTVLATTTYLFTVNCSLCIRRDIIENIHNYVAQPVYLCFITKGDIQFLCRSNRSEPTASAWFYHSLADGKAGGALSLIACIPALTSFPVKFIISMAQE